MKKARFTAEQIIAILQEHAAGAEPADLVRRHGISTCNTNTHHGMRVVAPAACRTRAMSATIVRTSIGLLM